MFVFRRNDSATLRPSNSLMMSRFGDKWSGLMLWWKPLHRPDVDHLKELIAAGQVRPVIDRRYPLSQVVEALRWVEDGNATGKVVISISDPERTRI